MVSRSYDPLGHHYPIVVNAKSFLQDIWKEGIDWDEVLPTTYVQRWNEIANDMELASAIPNTRSIHLEGESTSSELHIFCDASETAHCTAAYLCQSNSSRTSSNLIMCQTRVASIKDTTIPRLELLAAVIGIRLVKFIRQQMRSQFRRVCVWTDSTCVLG